ncbi:hypothetical protein [Ammoniphilus sp. 3BR4]|uniref:hypothetical protein n=1 Tax=Ammoniphilus sp. 3BR4 TaxID=3158265 RepID=UPI00346507F6
MLLLELNKFWNDISLIGNIELLKAEKDIIKNSITDASINWVERMIRYKKVQLINERIVEISKKDAIA